MTDLITGPPDEWSELMDLTRENGGRISPADVLERAQSPDSSFHQHFTWDDTEAAHKYRLQQAAALIRKFRIVRESNGRTIQIPAMVRMGDSINGYAPTAEVIGTDWVVQKRRLELIARLEKLAEELAHWEEFTALAEAIAANLPANN